MAHPNTRHVVSTGCRDYLFPRSIVSKYMSSPCTYYSLCSHSAGCCCLSKNKYVRRPAIMSTASSPDGNILDSGATFSLLLSPTILRSNLSPPTTFSLSPFLHAGRLTLIFTSPHDLLVEDNLSDSTVLSEQQSQLTSYQRRKVGLSEKEREWPIGSQSSYSGDSPVQRNTTGSPAPATVTAQSSHHQRPMFSKRLFGAHYRALVPIPHLIYVPLDRLSR